MYSTTCVGKISGKPLGAYASLAEAEEGVRYVARRWGKAMVSYRCQRCGQWHLSPRSRQTPSEPCPRCSKQSYRSARHAERRAAILRKEQGVSLRVYPCEFGHGYHLTSDTEGRCQ